MATRSGKIRGGFKAKAYLRKIRAAWSLSRSVRVGFFREARYTNGVSVARVATIHEFGSGPFKERPFFRTALKGAEKVLLPVMKQTINPRTMVFDNITAGACRTGHGLPDPAGGHEVRRDRYREAQAIRELGGEVGGKLSIVAIWLRGEIRLGVEFTTAVGPPSRDACESDGVLSAGVGRRRGTLRSWSPHPREAASHSDDTSPLTPAWLPGLVCTPDRRGDAPCTLSGQASRAHYTSDKA